MFKINTIESGYIMADGGAMFGAIPKRAWQRRYPADEENLCPLAMRCVLAISDNRKILIDTGIGNMQTESLSYYQPHDLINLDMAIQDLGYSIHEITDVVISHLHFDHCGYVTHKDKNGDITPSFPNAKYWISKKQWTNAQSPNRLEADSIFIENILPIREAGLLHLIDSDTLLYDGFNLRLFDGHTSGQLVVYIDTEDGVCTFPGDLIPTASHVSLNWISAYDICALSSISEKERFLAKAEKEGYTLIYYHDAIIKKSKVKKINNNFKALIIEP